MFVLSTSITVYVISQFLIPSSISEDVLFIAKRGNDTMCVTNSTHPLVWLSSASSQVSNVVPPVMKNDFDCDINSADNCTKHWNLEGSPWKLNSFNSADLKHFISDRRWEGMNIFSENLGKCIPTTSIPNVENFTTSLAVFNATKFCICNINISLCFPNECESQNIVKNQWIFISISKNQNTIQLDMFNASLENIWHRELNITPESDGNQSMPEYLFVNVCGDSRFYWKSHYYEYLYTKRMAFRFQLGPAINIPRNSNSICISMFISKCKDCKFKFDFEETRNSRIINHEEKTISSKSNEWDYIQLELRNISNSQLHLYVSTLLVSLEGDDYFWAIDDVRLCNAESYFRAISMPKNPVDPGQCQIVFDTSSQIKFCPRCDQLYDQKECSDVYTTRKIENNQIICEYSALYSYNGENSKIYTYIIILIVLLSLVLILVSLSIFFLKKRRSKNVTTSTVVSFFEYVPPSPTKLPTSNIYTSKENVVYDSKPIPVANYESYLQNSMENGELERQFNALHNRQPLYVEIETTDRSESTKTKKYSNNGYFECSNAEYVDGYKTRNAFITTQSCKSINPRTLWRIVWQENVRAIIWMSDTSLAYLELYKLYNLEKIDVKLVSKRNFSHFDKTVYSMKKNGKVKELVLYHFKDWNEHPPLCAQNLSELMNLLLRIDLNQTDPILLHSSSVEKMLLLICIDTVLRMIGETGHVDVLGVARSLRKQFVISTLSDFVLIHLIVQEVLSHVEFGEMSCDELKLLKEVQKNSFVQIQVHCIPQFLKKRERNTRSHRHQTDSYENIDLVSRLHSTLNTSIARQYRSEKQFLISRQPNCKKVADFWCLVFRRDVSLIISFNRIESHDDRQSRNSFYPTRESELFSPSSEIFLRHLQTREMCDFDVLTISVQLQGDSSYKIIELLVLKFWSETQLLPNNIPRFLKFLQDSRNISTKSKQVLLTCRDGISCSSVYIASLFLLEMLKYEKGCDVFKAVQHAPPNSMNLLKKKEYILFFYELALNYVQTS